MQMMWSAPWIAKDGSNPETAPPPKTKTPAFFILWSWRLQHGLGWSHCHLPTSHSVFSSLLSQEEKRQARVSLWVPKTVTTITTENVDPSLITARNDCLLNSYNSVQLSGWRANVDMQYVVSRRRVINYVAKYAIKSEPRSKSLKTVYSTIMKSLKDDDKSLIRSWSTVSEKGTTLRKRPVTYFFNFPCSLA